MTKTSKHKLKLNARNHQIIGTRQSYDSEVSCKNGIKGIAQYAPDANVVEF